MRYIRKNNLGATAAALFCSFRPGPASSFSLFAAADNKQTIFQPIVVRRSTSTGSRLPSPSSSLSSTMDDQTVKSSSSSSSSSSTPATTKKLKVLALHGSGGTAKEFPKRLDALNKALLSTCNEAAVQLEITTVQGPFDKDDGYSWWTMPDGVRSFNAKEYTGFEESATKVLDVWEKEKFDVVLGHSQGAILIASLIALKRTPYHPRQYIMNGCSFPNPYTQQLESLSSSMGTSSVVADNNKSNDDDDSSSHSNVLFVLGKQDKITPNSSGEQVRDLLKKGGFTVSSCYHDGGHGFPEEDTNDEAMKQIVNWILR
jgi:predicted esterase